MADGMPRDFTIERLAGRIETVETRLDGRINNVEARVTRTEEWVKESKEFHVEMRRNWDTLMGRQMEKEKIDAQRHQENKERIDRGNLLTAVGLVFLTLILAIAAWATFFKESSHSFLKAPNFVPQHTLPEVSSDQPQTAIDSY